MECLDPQKVREKVRGNQRERDKITDHMR